MPDPQPPAPLPAPSSDPGLLRSRDVSQLRVRALNSARLHAHLRGKALPTQEDQVDRIARERDQGPESLLVRAMAVLYDIAKDDTNKPTIRVKAAAAVCEMATALRQDDLAVRRATAELTQRSEENVGKMTVEMRKLELMESPGAGFPARSMLERIARGGQPDAPGAA